jgi:PAS domain S-box-containing protein
MRSLGTGAVFRLVFPAVLALALFVVAIYAIFIPGLESSLMERKRELIREITATAWSQLAYYHRLEQQGVLSTARAQNQAQAALRALRYGEADKDYIWLTDTTPTMLMHPYRPELEGQDLGGYTDPDGKRLFVEHSQAVRAQGQAFVSYRWQWMDDPSRIVPKISHVRGFKPWGWIVGTGIYLEDVQQEIRKVSQRLAWISTTIAGLIGGLLAINLAQSLRSESRRQQAEAQLSRSRERYRALVEASREGVVMALQGSISNANRTACQLLGEPSVGWREQPLDRILPVEGPARALYQRAGAGDPSGDSGEAHLLSLAGELVPVWLSVAPVTVHGQSGVILTFKDLRRAVPEPPAPGQAGLLDIADIGVLRCHLDLRGVVSEHNQAAARLLGYGSEPGLQGRPVRQLVARHAELRELVRDLQVGQAPRGHLVHLAMRDGGELLARIWTVSASGDSDEVLVLIRSVAAEQAESDKRDALIAEFDAQRAATLRPIGDIAVPASLVPMSLPVTEAAKQLSKAPARTLLLTGDDDNAVGIVTHADLLRRVVVEGLDPDAPVYQVMTAPLRHLPADTPLVRAVDVMLAQGVGHLAISRADGGMAGVLGWREAIPHLRYSGEALVAIAQQAEDVDLLAACREKIPVMQRASLRVDLGACTIMRLGTESYDAILRRIIDLTLAELGPPPRAFAFLVIGSQGRFEQTLSTDQDNALIFADSRNETPAQAREWFLRFARKVTADFNRCGVPLCNGEAMASNPKWCLSASEWQQTFHAWIDAPEPQDLIDVNIFFDFRCLTGDQDLVDQLRQQIFQRASGNDIFFYQLAHSTLEYKTPVGLFGNLRTEKGGEHSDTFNVKDVLLQIVNFARIYALRHRVPAVGTRERLDALQQQEVLSPETTQILLQAFGFLQDLRLRHQDRRLRNHEAPDNHVDPSHLSELDLATLKHIFSHIGHLQSRIRYDFARQA